MYLSKCAEEATRCFVAKDKANIAGLVVAGPGNIKNELLNNKNFDPRVKAKVVKVIDVAYGGRMGFFEALSKSADTFQMLQLIEQQRSLTEVMTALGEGTNLAVIGVADTVRFLDEGNVKKLLLAEEHELQTVLLWSAASDSKSDPEGKKVKETIVARHVVTSEEELKECVQKLEKYKTMQERVEIVSFTDWVLRLSEEQKFDVQILSYRTPEYHQFLKGMQGIAAQLRFPAVIDDAFEFASDDDEAESFMDDNVRDEK